MSSTISKSWRKLISIPTYLSDEVVESLVSSNPSLHHINISRSNSLTITRSSLCLERTQAKMKSKFFRQENFDGVQVSVTKKTSRSINLIAENCPQLTHIENEYCLEFSSNNIQKLITACPKLTYANYRRTK